MSDISKGNIKRVLGRPVSDASNNADILRKSDGVAAVSGDISGADGVTTTAGAGGDDLIIGLAAITPDGVSTPLVKTTNHTTYELTSTSGLNITQGSMSIRNVTLSDSSGNFRATPRSVTSGVFELNYTMTPSGAYTATLGQAPLAATQDGWIRIMVGGALKYIPLWS